MIWPVGELRDRASRGYPRSGGRITGVNDDHECSVEEPDAGDDPFDRRWSRILDAEADLLRRYAEQLLMTGSISIKGRAAY